MNTDTRLEAPVHGPLADLERHLISAYIAGAGYTVEDLFNRTDEDAKRLLAEASQLKERSCTRRAPSGLAASLNS